MFETMDIPFINETIDILDIKISTVNIRVLHPYVICIEGRYDCSRIVFKKEFEVPAVFSLYADSLREILLP